MTSGGLMQLVAYGAQDVYLTANPQVTFFKQLYRRHTNFAMESIEQTFNGVANFNKRVTCTISRNGDLISRIYLQVTLPSIDVDNTFGDGSGNFSWVPFVGQFLIDEVEVEIGGQRIDKHYGDWLHIWNELTLPTGKAREYLSMVNGFGGITAVAAGDASGSCSTCVTEPTAYAAQLAACMNANLAGLGSDCALGLSTCYNSAYVDASPAQLNSGAGCLIPEQTLYIPLEFWFNRHTGLALPLIALQYHEVKINLTFNDWRYLVNMEGINGAATSYLNQQGLQAASLYVDYIYLDTEERRRFAQVAHEYLIEQLQFTGEESVTSSSNKIQMSFNHPVKELIWVVQNPSYLDCNSATNQPWRYTDAYMGNPVAVAKIQLNGHDRFSEREGKYFNTVQPYQHHTASPSTGINVYSFALKPEELQPSGSCNFSRIDNAVLNLTLQPSTFLTAIDSFNANDDTPSSFPSTNTYTTTPSQNSALVRIYAVNYNVLRIMSGMGGLAYSN
jgi:hypothetical protein